MPAGGDRGASWDARAGDGGAGRPTNFEEYCLRHFGAGISKHFMIPYNEKIWGVSPARDHRRLVLALRAAAEPGTGDRGRRRRRAARDGLQPELPLSEVGRHRDLHARAADARRGRPACPHAVQPRRGRLAAARGHRRRRALQVPRAGRDAAAARAAEAHDGPAARDRDAGGAPALHDAALPEHRRARPAARRLALDLRARAAVSVLPRERVLDRDAQHGPARAARRSASRWPTAARSPTRPCATRRRRWSRRARCATRTTSCSPSRSRSSTRTSCSTSTTTRRRARSSRSSRQNAIYPRGRYGAWTYNAMEDCVLAGREVAALIDGPGRGVVAQLTAAPARLDRHPRLQRGGDPARVGAGAGGEAAPLRLELRAAAVRERLARSHRRDRQGAGGRAPARCACSRSASRTTARR